MTEQNEDARNPKTGTSSGRRSQATPSHVSQGRTDVRREFQY